MGNPLSYRGHSLEWSRIRLLTKWDNVVMEYNASGIRTRKGDTYYELDGNNIISETTNGNTIRYYYGSNGVVGFRYNGSRYYYEKNLMGDIIAIYDESGNKLGGYAYDAWGNCTITANINNVATANPFRYRGYYFDSDLGLYYLKTRYYDAQVGRFINADEVSYLGANGDLNSYNLFAYCGDNPVNCEDSSGTFWEELWNTFAQTLQQNSGYFVVAAGVSQIDSPILGPADVVSGVLLLGGVMACAGLAIFTNKAASPITISKDKEKSEAITASPSSNGTTYYHVTTMTNASAIMATHVMIGSKWESGYVYAWKTNPSKYAIENSGAHMGVTISFKTNVPFVMDIGITDPKVQMYGPVVSAVPGPIVVWDVQILG